MNWIRKTAHFYIATRHSTDMVLEVQGIGIIEPAKVLGPRSGIQEPWSAAYGPLTIAGNY